MEIDSKIAKKKIDEIKIKVFFIKKEIESLEEAKRKIKAEIRQIILQKKEKLTSLEIDIERTHLPQQKRTKRESKLRERLNFDRQVESKISQKEKIEGQLNVKQKEILNLRNAEKQLKFLLKSNS